MVLAAGVGVQAEPEAAEGAPRAVIIVVVAPVTMVPEMREATRAMAILGAPPASITEATSAKVAQGVAMVRGITAGTVDRRVAALRK